MAHRWRVRSVIFVQAPLLPLRAHIRWGMPSHSSYYRGLLCLQHTALLLRRARAQRDRWPLMSWIRASTFQLSTLGLYVTDGRNDVRHCSGPLARTMLAGCTQRASTIAFLM